MDLSGLLEVINRTETVQMGSSVAVAQYCRDIGLVNIVNELVEWDEVRSHVSPGTRVLALVVNALGGRKPLYRVIDYYRDKDLDLLFDETVTLESFEGYSLARTLDKMHEAGCERVFSALALSAVAAHEIQVRTIHFDTTSRSVYGEYETEPREDVIDITYGFSKDHRPDLKQFMFGVGSNHEGVPIFGQVLSGNASDMTWNREVVRDIKSRLPAEFVSDVVYAADSSVVTLENLEMVDRVGIKFISRVPARFTLPEELSRMAWEDGAPWEEIGPLSGCKGAASYKMKSYHERLNGRVYRFCVVHSTSLDKRRTKGLDRKVLKKREEIEKAAQTLAKREFICIPDAERAVAKFLDEWKGNYHELRGHVAFTFKREKRKTRGRPPKDAAKPPATVVYTAVVEILGVDEHQIEEEQRVLSTFVLITNQLDPKNISDRDVLYEYKNQSTVENLFKFIKDPLRVDAVFLKDPGRVEALGCVILIAALIASLLQRRVRGAIAQEGEPIFIPGHVRTMTPTAGMILDMLNTIKIKEVALEGGVLRHWPNQDNHFDISRLLRLAGLSQEIYTRGRAQRTGGLDGAGIEQLE